MIIHKKQPGDGTFVVYRVLRRGRAPQYFIEDVGDHLMDFASGLRGQGVIVKYGLTETVVRSLADRLTRQRDEMWQQCQPPSMVDLTEGEE